MDGASKESIVARVRDLCHEEQHKGEATPLIVAALELAEEYEKLDRLATTVEEELEGIQTILEMSR